MDEKHAKKVPAATFFTATHQVSRGGQRLQRHEGFPWSVSGVSGGPGVGLRVGAERGIGRGLGRAVEVLLVVPALQEFAVPVQALELFHGDEVIVDALALSLTGSASGI